jgi:hypothetical protein
VTCDVVHYGSCTHAICLPVPFQLKRSQRCARCPPLLAPRRQPNGEAPRRSRGKELLRLLSITAKISRVTGESWSSLLM